MRSSIVRVPQANPRRSVFDAAARELLWHYQTVVLREFLPSLIGAELTDLIAQGDRRYYRPRDQPFIPLEFADAAYRYGHSQIRHTYQLNAAGGAVPIFPDLLGFRPIAAEHQIEWPRLFDARRCSAGGPRQENRRPTGRSADRTAGGAHRCVRSGRVSLSRRA